MPGRKKIRIQSGIYRDEFGAIVNHTTVTVFPELSEHRPDPRSDLDFVRVANYLRGQTGSLIQFNNCKGIGSLAFKTFRSGVNQCIAYDFTGTFEFKGF